MWAIIGYINGYEDGTEKKHKGVISVVILLVICIIGEIAQKVVMK